MFRQFLVFITSSSEYVILSRIRYIFFYLQFESAIRIYIPKANVVIITMS
jgi:hypothetical protein